MWLLTVKLCLVIAGDAECDTYHRYYPAYDECMTEGRALAVWVEENSDVPAIEDAAFFGCTRGLDT